MDKELIQNTFKQIMEMWVMPEIKKRKQQGKLAKDFKLKSAQIVFSLDKEGNKVRLNEEVKAIANVKINRSKEKGEIVYEHEIGSIESIRLTEKEKNCAHITLLLINNYWVTSFDFVYNKKIIKNHINAAEEFLKSVRYNLSEKLLRPFFENSFACVELLTKSILLQFPDKDILHGKNHHSRIKKFEDFTQLGNAKVEYSELLSRLNSLRESARYLGSTEFKKENQKKILKIIEEMMDYTKKLMDEDFDKIDTSKK